MAPDDVGVAIPGLRRLTADELDIVVAHPAQQRCVIAIPALLAELRECASADDYDELQRDLFVASGRRKAGGRRSVVA